MNEVERNNNPIILEPITRTIRIPVSDQNIFTFPEGIPAFEEYHQFVLYCNTDVQPFFFMKSIGVNPEISFVCIDPFLIYENYRVRVGRADLNALGLDRGEDAFVFSTVTVSDDPREITANLQGPMIINTVNSIGKQVISEGTTHDVKYRIWDVLNKLEEYPKSPLDMMVCDV